MFFEWLRAFLNCSRFAKSALRRKTRLFEEKIKILPEIWERNLLWDYFDPSEREVDRWWDSLRKDSKFWSDLSLFFINFLCIWHHNIWLCIYRKLVKMALIERQNSMFNDLWTVLKWGRLVKQFARRWEEVNNLQYRTAAESILREETKFLHILSSMVRKSFIP